MERFPNLTVTGHPLIQHKLSYIRDKNTPKKVFKELVDEVGTLMAYEISRDFPLQEVEVQTPMQKTITSVLAGDSIVLVPLLRAGLGMVDGVLNLIPTATVLHLGLYRDEKTLEPVTYYYKPLPDSEDRQHVMVDPMLATGGSAISAATMLKRSGVKKIKFMCLIAAPEGVRAFTDAHPDIPVYAASLDEKLNENGYIMPGLGDAGDRLFGTV